MGKPVFHIKPDEAMNIQWEQGKKKRNKLEKCLESKIARIWGPVDGRVKGMGDVKAPPPSSSIK